MTVTVEWADETHTLIIQTFSGSISIDDYRDTARRSAELLQTVDHPVDIIILLIQVEFSGGTILGAVRYAASIRPANQRHLIIVNATLFLKTLIDIASRMAPQLVAGLHYVDTLEQAHAWLNAQRGSDHNPPP